MENMKKLPIGIQSFEVIRTEGYYYVDKTIFVEKLVSGGKYYFLSRPRRFGKSLFLDTLRQAFLGKRELFKGLYLENHWDWDRCYPVVYISFGAGVHRDVEELRITEEEILEAHARKYKLTLTRPSIKGKFLELIEMLCEEHNEKVVVLIDEYDKPILDNIEHPEVARETREELKNFYSVLKDADPYLKFVFITGVSKFSKVSLFSGLNNLNDITIHPRYATICGYTQEEFETVFADRLSGVSFEEVSRWYNGYSWLGEPVYNPFDILLYLDSGLFRAYWFETGTPTFLIKLLLERKYYLPKLEELEVGEELLESFDVDYIRPETLLFQTGYLTIKRRETSVFGDIFYTLTYPNLEVKKNFYNYFLNFLVKDVEVKSQLKRRVERAIVSGEVEEMVESFKGFLVSIPHDWYRKTELAGYEGFYASVFYAFFTALGVEVRVEEPTNRGRLDMALMFEDKCYLFEFKVVEGEREGKALEELKARGYHEKYTGRFKEIYLIGIEFSKSKRNIVSYKWESF